jgi:hypothetical protein
VENADAGALAGLLAEDVAREMPPLLTWFTGREAVARYFAAQPFVAPGRLPLIAVTVTVNGQPAFASYVRERDGTYYAHAVTLPTLTSAGIARSSPSASRACSGPSACRRSTPPPGWPRRRTGRSLRGPAEQRRKLTAGPPQKSHGRPGRFQPVQLVYISSAKRAARTRKNKAELEQQT